MNRWPDRELQLPLLATAAAIVMCFADTAWAQNGSRWHIELTPLEQVRLILLQGIAAAYLFTLGAVLGSFLNVVIYRLPRGLNIVRPGSRCPACATPIALKDNIPVIGWLRLRGKCRICGGPISVRYPLVEAAVGSLMLILFWLEVRLGGINLPYWTPAPLDALTILSWRMPWGNFLFVVYHAWLLITLLVMALIQGDGLRVPAVIVCWALAVALILPLAWPWLRPVPVWVLVAAPDQRLWWHAIVDGLAGASAGVVIGSALAFLASLGRPGYIGRDLIAATLLVGAYLGWQAVLTLGLFSGACLLGASLITMLHHRNEILNPLAWLTAGTWLYVVLWNKIVALVPGFVFQTSQ